MTRRIDSYSIRLFVAAARAGSIVRAAAAENIAPSALSRRIADLEHAFETPLLVRSPRGIALTDAGRLVLARGERIDDELQALLREVQSEGGEVRGTVRLHANMSSVIGFLPERLHRFMETYPGVEVALHEEDTRRDCLVTMWESIFRGACRTWLQFARAGSLSLCRRQMGRCVVVLMKGRNSFL